MLERQFVGEVQGQKRQDDECKKSDNIIYYRDLTKQQKIRDGEHKCNDYAERHPSTSTFSQGYPYMLYKSIQ